MLLFSVSGLLSSDGGDCSRDITREKRSEQRMVSRSQMEVPSDPGEGQCHSKQRSLNSVAFYRHFSRVHIVHVKGISGGP